MRRDTAPISMLIKYRDECYNYVLSHFPNHYNNKSNFNAKLDNKEKNTVNELEAIAKHEERERRYLC